MQGRRINVEGIGEVFFAPGRARNLRLTLRPFQGLRVSVPRGVSLAAARRFVEDNRGWVARQLPRMRRCEEAHLAAAVIDRDAAAAVLAPRLAALAAHHGFSYHRVSFRRQRTRWGSCSAANNISLNVRLVALPEELRDYVLLHELLHTRIKHHGPAFWDALEKLAGDARAKAARLRRHGLAG